MKTENEYMSRCLDSIAVKYDEIQVQKLIDFYHLIIEKNKVMNLTAITDFQDAALKHFADSLSVLRFVDFKKEDKVLDIGTGAGFPGVPLKVFNPDTEFLLMDSVNKKLKFVDEAIENLGLKRISTIHGRAEDLAHDFHFREKFDYVVSRAVANFSTLIELCLPFVKLGGGFVAYKSGSAEEEVRHGKKSLKINGGRVEDIVSLNLNGEDMERKLIFIRKIDETPIHYPRKAGIPSKEPL